MKNMERANVVAGNIKFGNTLKNPTRMTTSLPAKSFAYVQSARRRSRRADDGQEKKAA